MERIKYIRVIENAALSFCMEYGLKFADFKAVNLLHPIFINLDYKKIKEWIICHDAIHFALGQPPDGCGEATLAVLQNDDKDFGNFEHLYYSPIFNMILNPVSTKSGFDYVSSLGDGNRTRIRMTAAVSFGQPCRLD